VVTGSTSGIGRATAEPLARAGMLGMVSGRDETRGRESADAIVAAGGQARFVRADLRSVAGARALAEAATRAAGEVDVLVNNAGAFSFAPSDQTDEGAYEEMMDVNVRAPSFLTAALAPKRVERRHGKVVNVSAMAASTGRAGAAAYGASNAGLELLTEAWAAELGPSGVNVNAIVAGSVHTPGTAVIGELLDQIAARLPAGRVADPGEIAAAVVYHAGDGASCVNDAVLAVDGGGLAS
jgi:NAD(P)-dependent dehydrogenase (short-subunit alcohol dehydrogenase family)